MMELFYQGEVFSVHHKIAVFIIVLAIVIFQSVAWAENADKTVIKDGMLTNVRKQIRLDGIGYSTDQLIWDFTNVSIGNSLWGENPIQPWSSIGPFYERELRLLKPKRSSWISEFIDRPDGLPRVSVINKWTYHPDIGIGWPRYQMDFLNEKSKDPEAIKAFKVIVENVLLKIERETDIKYKLLAEDDPVEKTEQFAKIRIVPARIGGEKSETYKIQDVYPYWYISENISQQVISGFVGAVHFSPRVKKKVDGFLLPKSDNSIGLAVCRIDPYWKKDLIEHLVTECVVRATGLTDLSQTIGPHILASSELPAKEGEFPNPVFPADIAHEGLILSEYDTFMLRLFNCPEIKAGMDRAEVVHVLIKNNNCISDASKIRE